MRRVDRTGQRFGRLTAVSQLEFKQGGSIWICRCDCGKVVHVNGGNLQSGNTKSCGCAQFEKITKHAEAAKSPEYNIWLAMNQRCANPNHREFLNYGGRGIRVCDRWNPRKCDNAYQNFLEDMGRRPGPKLSLDRIDNADGYNPGNCEWRGTVAQRLNQRVMRRSDNKLSVRWVTVGGETKCLKHWADSLGITVHALYHYIRKGLTDREAVEHFIQKQGA